MALETPTQLQNESTRNGELPIAEYVDVFRVLGVSNVYTGSGSKLTLACAGVRVKEELCVMDRNIQYPL